MSKRKFGKDPLEPPKRRVAFSNDIKKHTLDSDEEDFVDEDNILDENDIEGEEDGLARQDGEQRMTAFNMKEEMEEGHFDRDGHFIWNNEKEIRDNWLDNIDWQKIKNDSDSAQKYDINEEGLGAESDSESESEEVFNETETYKEILKYLKPKESVNKALKRLGGADMKLSSVERLKRKKAGTLTNNEDITKLTELSNKILSKLGNMDIYQETYEQIQSKITKNEEKSKSSANVAEAEFDMFSDDFQEREKGKIEATTSKTAEEKEELKWEYKEKAEDEKIHGPFTTSEMIKMKKDGKFQTGFMVRKCEENTNFYSLNRIDFELYE